MRKKIVGIFVMTLFIASAVLPALGTMNEIKDSGISSLDGPTVEWLKTYGGEEFDHFHTVRQTDDGGYIACGVTEESDMFYVWLLKVDSYGNEEWSKINYNLNGTYISNTEMWVVGLDVIQTSDGGYITSGVSMIEIEFHGEASWGTTGFLWKSDDEGNTDWIKHYYGLDVEEGLYASFLYNVIEIEDGYVAGGFKFLYDSETATIIDTDGYILKTDFSGNQEWDNTFSKCLEDTLSSITQTSDGGYFLGGCLVDEEEYEGGYALWMVKTDANGIMEWDQIFDGPGFEYTYGKGFCETNDGGYIMNANTNSYGYGQVDNWIIKTDSSGNMEWNKTFGGTKNDYTWSMCSCGENGFIFGICANYGGFGGTQDDMWIIKTDNDGNAEWKLQIEESGKQITRSVSFTNDGGVIVAAMTSHFGGRNSDGVLAKISSSDNQRPNKPEKPDGPKRGKPDTEYTFSTTAIDPDGGSLYYRWNWGDGNFSDILAGEETTYTWSYEDNFEVRVMAIDEHGGESEWSDPLAFSTPRHKDISQYNILFWRILERFMILKSPY
ncbi:PKD domain-containing protein [Thermoplasmatota archaeon]